MIKKLELLVFTVLALGLCAQNFIVENGQFNSTSGFSTSDSFSELGVVSWTESGTSTNAEYVVETGSSLITTGTLTEIDLNGVLPTAFSVKNNYPNPFNPNTQIEFTIPELRATKVEIYNCRGQVVRTLFDRSVESGVYTVIWDGSDDAGHELPSGLYVTRVQSGYQSDVVKMLLLK